MLTSTMGRNCVLAAGCAIAVASWVSTASGQFVENPTVHYTLLPSTVSFGTFGWAVADVADLDADGVREFLVGAPGPGRLYVYSGMTGSLIYTLQASPVEPGGGQFGYSMGDAGDVNGDQVSDIVVGGVLAANGFGAVYLYSGATGAFIRRTVGQANGDRFGTSVASAGDINSDGRSDILVGAEGNDTGGANAGRAYVYSGATGALLRTYAAESSGDSFGGGIGNTGDLNGDGFSDHIIAAHDAGPTSGGRAYVYSGLTGAALLPTLQPVAGAVQFGNFFVSGPGDVNNDGTPDLYVGDYAADAGRGRVYIFSGTNGATLHSIPGPLAGDGFGCGRGAGDVNGDHHADFIVGSYTNSSGAPQAGRATVYSGIDGSVLQTITSQLAGINFGFDAIGLGDVNGDDKLDFLVSAATGDLVYLIGGSVMLPPTVACCGQDFPNVCLEDKTELDCGLLGDTYWAGAGSTCENADCAAQVPAMSGVAMMVSTTAVLGVGATALRRRRST